MEKCTCDHCGKEDFKHKMFEFNLNDEEETPFFECGECVYLEDLLYGEQI